MVAPAAPAAPQPAARRKPRARKPAPPQLPPTGLQLSVDAPSPDGPWTMHLENSGTIPVRVLADARLLALDVTPGVQSADADDDDDAPAPSARTARHRRCELPADMRPSEGDDRGLVLPPGRSYAEKLDARLFCFGARDAAALAGGAKVTPHLVGSRDTAVIEPIDEVEPKIASVTDWTGTPVTIGPAVAPGASKEATPPDALVVSTPAFADFALGWEVEVAVTVTNKSPQSVTFLLRPETLSFDVTGPSGVGVTDPSPTVHCGWPGPPPPPISEAFTRLPPRQTASISVMLNAFCPDETLRHPGLYVVRAKLDTRRASGASIGVHAFAGTALAIGTTRVRVREWNGPPPQAGRPVLVELPVQPAH
ncbi:MAG: hypothetical protein ACLQVI_28450 [Polyangiaceae bacterium]